jgi:hypothetical protein
VDLPIAEAQTAPHAKPGEVYFTPHRKACRILRNLLSHHAALVQNLANQRSGAAELERDPLHWTFVETQLGDIGGKLRFKKTAQSNSLYEFHP